VVNSRCCTTSKYTSAPGTRTGPETNIYGQLTRRLHGRVRLEIHDEDQHRPDLSSPNVREDVAVTGLCGNVHLPTGRTCHLPERHPGSCHFVGPDDAGNLTAG
jgi:hypothetical protein